VPNLNKPFIIASPFWALVVIAAGLLLMPIITPVRAHSGDEVVAVYGTTPTVDGTISTGEWDDASTVTFSVTDGTCTVYVKQDGSNLYVAFDIPDTTSDPGDDSSYVFLDVEHNDGTAPQTDDRILKVTRSGALSESEGSGTGWDFLVTVDGWTAACSSTAAGFQIEYSITYSKIGVTAGEDKTLGVMLLVYDRYNGGYPYQWPPGSDTFEISTWADLTMPARALPVGGFEAPINTLALLAPWIIMILATSFGAILVAKRKRKH